MKQVRKVYDKTLKEKGMLKYSDIIISSLISDFFIQFYWFLLFPKISANVLALGEVGE